MHDPGRHFLSAVSCAVLVVGLASGCGRESAPVLEPESPPAPSSAAGTGYVRATDEALLDRAMRRAQETQSDFIAALESPRPLQSGFSVKRAFPTTAGGTEHIWLNDPVWDGTNFRGTVDSLPVNTTGAAVGDRVMVPPDELTDWMYVDDQQVVGGYTLRVLYSQYTPAQQRSFTEQTRLKVPPVDF